MQPETRRDLEVTLAMMAPTMAILAGITIGQHLAEEDQPVTPIQEEVVDCHYAQTLDICLEDYYQQEQLQNELNLRRLNEGLPQFDEDPHLEQVARGILDKLIEENPLMDQESHGSTQTLAEIRANHSDLPVNYFNITGLSASFDKNQDVAVNPAMYILRNWQEEGINSLILNPDITSLGLAVEDTERYRVVVVIAGTPTNQ